MISVIAHSMPMAARQATQAGVAASMLRLTAAASRQVGNQRLQVVRQRRMISAKPSAEAGKVAGESAAHQERTVGDKIVFAGMLLRGAAIMPRFVAVAPMLRFAGAGPMFLGAIVSAYEFGGWYLLLGFPAAGFALNGICMCADNMYDDAFRSEIMNSVREACPDVPAEAFEGMRMAKVHQFETNCARLEYVWPDAATGRTPQWRVQARGARQSAFRSWTPESLQVSKAVVDQNVGLPPQTRWWDSESWPTRWEVAWEQA